MDTLTTLFPFGWQGQRLPGLVIGNVVTLLFVLTVLVGGMSSARRLRAKP
jgi:hypothetical protein